MESAQNSNDWQSILAGSYEHLVYQIVSYLPQVTAVLVLLLIGWLVAWLLSKVTAGFLAFTNRAAIGFSQKLHSDKPFQLRPNHMQLISRVVFWLTMMFFFAAAASSLGLDFFSGWFASLFGYLPKLIAGVLIIIGGYLAGNVISVMARASAQSIGFSRVDTAARIAKLIVLFTAVVIGVEQLGINIQFVTHLVIVLTGVMCFGIALAFGLGSRDLIANTVAARQVLRHCRVNDQIEIAGLSGKLTEITGTMVVIETEKGRTLIPASVFLQQPCSAQAASVNESAQ